MTDWECFSEGVKLLEKAQIENSRFDAMCLFEKAFEINRTELFLNKDSLSASEKCDAFFSMIKKRCENYPLQYILGSWEFYGFDFFVGEGVLIPRPETELLVDYVVDNPVNGCPVIFDLCSGTGCIGISVGKLIENATVYLSEKSEDAYKYILKNIELNGVKNVRPFCVPIPEIFGLLPKADIIVSNPPYIKTDELNSLQPEVQKEPMLALDGGGDGLYFYRVLKKYAFDRLNKNGYIIVECGDTQAEDVAKIFDTDLILKDYNNINRAVVAGKKDD